MSELPIIVIAGRPNVGKSTLFNRIAGRMVAIVERHPGVTRDRLELECDWAGRSFLLVDTGGLTEAGDTLDDKVTEQSKRAMAAADLVLFVMDSTTGVSSADSAVGDYLRRMKDKVLVVANKVDSEHREADAWELASLGLGLPHLVSSLHGRGIGDMLDEMIDRLPVSHDATGDALTPGPRPGGTAVVSAPAATEGPRRDGEDSGDEPSVREPAVVASVAIIGRPNVGKSTLFNRLVGEDRSVVHDLPGTTRDAIDTVVETEMGALRLVDTAGMRRRAREGEASEYFSLVRSLRALDHCDVALLVIDASEGVTHQDQRLAERIDASGSPVVLLLNKWDLLDTERRLVVGEDIADRLAFLGYAPVLRVSAKTGLGVHRLLPVIEEAIAAYHRRIPTSRLNEALKAAQSAHPAPGARILYAVQGAIDPPTITLFATRRLPPPYLRYLERSLRQRFELGPTPLDMRVRVRAQR
ncbi:MAG: ribosome biogenesis GTPase Der [Acidimicrobiales bacterium]